MQSLLLVRACDSGAREMLAAMGEQNLAEQAVDVPRVGQEPLLPPNHPEGPELSLVPLHAA